MSFGDTRRRVLALSATVGAVLIAIVMIAVYGLARVDVTMRESQAEIDRLMVMADDARVAQVAFKTQIQEWKNTLLRGYVAADYAAYHGAFLARREEVDRRLEQLKAAAGGLGFPVDGIADLRTRHDALDAAYDEAIKLYRPEDPLSVRAVDTHVRGKDRPLNEAFDKLVAQAKSYAEERRDALRENDLAMSRGIQQTLWISMAIGFAFLSLVAFMALRAIRK